MITEKWLLTQLGFTESVLWWPWHWFSLRILLVMVPTQEKTTKVKITKIIRQTISKWYKALKKVANVFKISRINSFNAVPHSFFLCKNSSGTFVENNTLGVLQITALHTRQFPYYESSLASLSCLWQINVKPSHWTFVIWLS